MDESSLFSFFIASVELMSLGKFSVSPGEFVAFFQLRVPTSSRTTVYRSSSPPHGQPMGCRKPVGGLLFKRKTRLLSLRTCHRRLFSLLPIPHTDIYVYQCGCEIGVYP
eukprot:g76009.t1